MSEFSHLEVIEIWDGNNYAAIIRALTHKNTEIRIRVSGKKLILKDTGLGFYRCVPPGDPVKIPKLEEPIVVDDPPIEPEPEPDPQLPTSAVAILTEEQRRMYQEWGLLPYESENPNTTNQVQS